MTFKTISDFNFKGKRVLLRADLNSEISDGKVVLSDRITESAKTIRELQKKGAKIVVLAHQSRPGNKDFISLKQHAKLLNKFIKIKFVPDILGKKSIEAISNLKNSDAILLENIRFLKEEFSPSENNKMVKTLAPLFDIYINDAFSVSHRAQTSVISFPKILPSGIGRVMRREITALNKILKMKNCLYILGGAKPEVNISLLKKSSRSIVCGLFGQLCLISQGYNLGKQNEILKKYFKYLPTLKKLSSHAITPIDFAVKINRKRKEIPIEQFPQPHEIFDIGEKTIQLFVGKIKKSKFILMKGTAGFCEEKQFYKGTFSLLKAIASSKAFSVIGGGHLTSALKKSGICQESYKRFLSTQRTKTKKRKFSESKNKFSYVSLSGGAMEEYLAGKKLPGLEVLKK